MKLLKITFFVIAISMGAYQAKAISILKPIITTGDNPVLETVGNLITYAVPLSALATTIVLKDWQGAGQFLISMMYGGATTGILKDVVKERRPWQPEGAKGGAFPSGHATAAFIGSWFWWRRFGWKYGVIASLFSLFVGYYRIEVQAHWIHDIVASAIISFMFVYLFVSKYAKPKLPPMINFVIKPKTKTYKISFHFNKDNFKL